MGTKIDTKKSTFSDKFVVFCEKWVPNSMVFAFLLTLLVAVLVLIFTKTPLIADSADGHISLMNSWVKGFWNLLTFAMQMSLIMITGAVVATSLPVKKLLRGLAKLPSGTFGAFAMLMVATAVLNWVHWGVGMMVSIFLGRELLAAAKDKGYQLHTNALVGTSYCMTITGIGISQAAPLLGATKGYLKTLVTAETAIAYLPDTIPMSQTALRPVVLTLCILVFALLFAVAWFLTPKTNQMGISQDLYDSVHASDLTTLRVKAASPSEWINNSPLLNMIIGIFGLIWVVKLLVTSGFVGISINNFNFMLLMLGVVLCGTPEAFCKGVVGAVETVWGVIIQFPFYAGIFGMIAYTGFSEVLVQFFMRIATPKSFPLVTYIYSAILNLAVPSGGSKFAIEAPYLMDVCARMHVDVGKVLCAYTFGDLTTNVIQPFWALPYLAMYKVDFRNILPYTFPLCLCAFAVGCLYIGFIF